jgi:MFS family permease
MQSVALLGPILSTQFALTPLEFGVLASSISVGSTLALPIGWAVGRRIGTHRLLTGSALVAGALVAVAGLALSGAALTVPLFLAGFSWGLSIPIGGGAMATAAPPGHRGLFASVRQLALPAGGVAASVIAPFVVGPFGWRGMLLLEGLLFWAAAGVGARARLPLRERTRRRQRPAPAIWPLGAMGLLVSGVQWAFVAYLTTDLTGRLKLPFAVAATLFLVSQVGGAAGRLAVGWLSDRLGIGRTPILAATSLGSGLSLLIFAMLEPGIPVAGIALVCGASGFLAMGWNGILIAAFAEAGPVDDATLNIAAGQTLNRLGSMAAPPLFGLALLIHVEASLLWISLGVLSILAAGGFLLAGRAFARVDDSWSAVERSSDPG